VRFSIRRMYFNPVYFKIEFGDRQFCGENRIWCVLKSISETVWTFLFETVITRLRSRLLPQMRFNLLHVPETGIHLRKNIRQSCSRNKYTNEFSKVFSDAAIIFRILFFVRGQIEYFFLVCQKSLFKPLLSFCYSWKRSKVFAGSTVA